MYIFFQILFWLSVLAIFHSYVLFPFILKLLAKNKEVNQDVFKLSDSNLPKVSVLMSLYNEEDVISEKIQSIFKSNYPSEKLELIVGSDNCDDKTNDIVSALCKENSNLLFFPFSSRQGKPSIINQLQKKSNGTILIITDANVIFSENTVFEMVKHYKNNNIGLVDTRMTNTKESISKTGISIQESSYNSREVKIKQNESLIWGTMMGPFGGCYSLKNELFKNVPINFLVDDFYINMNVLKKNKKAINCMNAIVYEDVSNNIKDEFRRKIRISTGNFQNLATFKNLLFSKVKGLSFSFFSHKVLRWFGPFLLIIALLSNIFLIKFDFYKISIIIFSATFTLPFIDIILKKQKINISILRFITHFYTMNIALLIGFFRFLSGVKSGIWQPTKRNQSK